MEYNSPEEGPTTNEAIILKKAFDDIHFDIKNDINTRISEYSQTLIHKYHRDMYYYLPKHIMLEIKDKGHKGYNIPPQQKFYVDDKKNHKSLTFTSKADVIIAPVETIKTSLNLNTINIDIKLDDNFVFDTLTLWLDPDICEKEPYLTHALHKQILMSTEKFAIVHFKDGTKKKSISLYEIKYQLTPTQITVLKTNSPSFHCGINIKIDELFKYKENIIEKISFAIKIDSNDYDENTISNIFKTNLLPIFNCFDDYSNSTYANLNLSNQKLIHHDNENAMAIDVLAVYENNNPCEFDGLCFAGQNEYFFNKISKSLNYSTLLPSLNKNLSDAKIYTFTNWVDNVSLSNLIEINTNFITSLHCKIIPLVVKKEINNFNQRQQEIFDLINMMFSKNIYSKNAICAVLKLLNISNENILLVMSLIDSVSIDTLTNEMHIISTKKYNVKAHYDYLMFLLDATCEFINLHSFAFIIKVNLIKHSE